jgi:hypothetical protein
MDRQHFKFDRPLHQLIVIGYHLTGSEGKGWLWTTLLRVSKPAIDFAGLILGARQPKYRSD